MDTELKKENRRGPRRKIDIEANAKKEAQERDKRHEIRRDIGSQKSMVEIPLPFPKGVKIVKAVTDSSEKGLAFKMARQEGFLLPGTTIKDLVIYTSDMKVEKPSAEVMYAVPITGTDCFKIGIKFTGGTGKRSALGRKAFTHTVRPLRHDLAALTQRNKLVRFKDHNGQQFTGLLKNISPYGLAFELQRTEDSREGLLKLSEIINNLQVVIGEETIYDGKATVANFRSIKDEVIVGVSLWDKSVDIQKILNQTIDSPDSVKSELAHTLLEIEKVNQTFKALVADMRFFLEEIKRKLDAEECKALNEGMIQKKMIEEAILMRFEGPVYPYLDKLMGELNKCVFNFDKEQQAYHLEYFQKQIGHLIWQSPFVKRAYLKPLGYAGDYEMMDMIYRDPYEGETWFAKILNKYFCHHIPPAQAIRNRVPFLLEKMKMAANRKINQRMRVRILSLACGPAKEVREFITSSEASDHAEITLVDIEPEALYYCQGRVLEAKTLAKRDTKLKVCYLPLHELLKEATKLQELENQDLIYSVGLFDYLSDKVTKKAISTLFKLLGKNGTLIIGNYNPDYQFRSTLEYCAEWFKFYRKQGDLIRIAEDLFGPGPRIFCETEPTGIDNFLIIEK